MEKMKIVVKHKSSKIDRLVEDFNNTLGEISNLLKRMKRQQEVKFDLETELMYLPSKKQHEEDDLALLMEMRAEKAKQLVEAKKVYENAYSDEDLWVDRDVLKYQLEYVADDMCECEVAISETNLKINRINANMIQYKKMHQMSEEFIENIKTELAKKVRELKRTAIILERVLGYSVGSHTLEWCLDKFGAFVLEPQLRQLEVVEQKVLKGSNCTDVVLVGAEERE